MKRFSAVASLSALVSMLVATVGLAAGDGTAYVKRTDEGLVLGNEFIELGFDKAEGGLTLSRLVNKLSGRTLLIQSDDFSLGIEGRQPLRAADFAFKEARDDPIPGGRRLVLRFENPAPGVQLDVIYELGHTEFFLRRRLEVSAGNPLPLRQVDVWRVKLQGDCSHQGFGKPVFLEDTFWGLEFPGGHNRLLAGAVVLSQFPGRMVDRFVSKTAVLGVARPGHVARRFRQYVETFQVTPKDRALFVDYNSYWTVDPPNEKQLLELIALFKRKLFDPYGESFDTFTLDNRWDNKQSLWEIHTGRFPRGFAPLVESLKSMNAELGLWLSPSSGYGTAKWGATAGYEVISNKNSNKRRYMFLCQSGPKYRRDIVKVVTGLTRKYNTACWKLDGYVASCDAEGHGHLPGEFGKEANIDAFIELLTAVRRVRPDVYLSPTSGMWHSPWWLKYADSLGGVVQKDYPLIVVPAPIVRDSATTTRDAVFRQRCHQNPGYPPAAFTIMNIIVITPEKWEDNAMIVLGRGCRLLTLYINPKNFQKEDRDWAFLASILKWVRHNAQTLQNTELILGDPFQREAYGYAHFRGPRGIFVLRNPFIEPQTAKLSLDESMGWSRADAQGTHGADGTFVARVVYPRHQVLRPVLRYGDSLELRLQAYETVVLHIEPADDQGPRLLGARCEETQRTGSRAVYAVYGRAGQRLTVPIVGVARPIKALFDGQPVALALGRKEVELPLVFAGREQSCAVEGGRLVAETSQTTWRLVGSCSLTVPPESRAAVHLLCDPRVASAGPFQAGSWGRLECTAQVNGKPVEVRAVRTPGRRMQTHAPHPWTWFEFDVPPGRSEVSVAITPGSDGQQFFQGEVGWWLWAEHPLKKGTLTLEFEEPLPPACPEPTPLPVGMEYQRQVCTIGSPKPFRAGAGSRWPKLDQPTLYLDEAAPDEVAQRRGTLARNKSCWGEEMIIAGRKFARGLGAHANGRIVYDLTGGKFRKFRCLVGRDEHAAGARVAFQVWVDKKKVFDSGPMYKTTPAKQVEVDVKGASVLELRTLDGGDGKSGDHGNWCDAQLVR